MECACVCEKERERHTHTRSGDTENTQVNVLRKEKDSTTYKVLYIVTLSLHYVQDSSTWGMRKLISYVS